MRPTLVALDLDGTLLERPDAISTAHAEAVAELLGMGVKVALVTGRPLMTTVWVWERLALTTPLVCFNGAWVGHPGAAPIARAALTQAEVRVGIADLRCFDGAICAYPDTSTWMMDREITHTRRWRDVYKVDIVVDPARFNDWHGDSYKLMYVCEPQRMPTIFPALHRQLGNDYQIVLSQEDRIEVMPRGISKAWGLSHLADFLGVATADVWAVGDADNDLEMISWAGHGCAMGQAAPAVRACARHILPPVQEDGLRRLPELLRAMEAGGGG